MRTEFTKATMREAQKRAGDCCEGLLASGERCNANLKHKPHHFDHIIPDAIGGPNDLANCQMLCVACHKTKTAKVDAPIIAKTKRNYDKFNGIEARKPKWRSQGFRRAKPQCTATTPLNKWTGYARFR